MAILPKKFTSSGFTIVELIVSLVVGAVLIGGTTLITVTYSRLSARALSLTVANSYAENKIESLRSIGFLGLSNGTTDISTELPAELKNPRSASVVVSSPSATTKKIDLTITYNDQGDPRTYAYTTYIGELGVGQY